MIPEIGHLCLILLMMLSLGCGLYSKIVTSSEVQVRSLHVLLGLISISLLTLFYSMWAHDFSVDYVYQHSSRNLSWWYRLSAVWGGHEGSLLLWLWMLVLWNFLISKLKGLDDLIKRHTLRQGLFLISGFSAFCVFTSNPFLRLLPLAPPEGTDLNPLLQDVGMLIHPPILYIGYVGSLMLYPLAIAVIKHPKQSWSQGLVTLCRIQWAVLTLGITLGSWWAYRVLGWGGVWFWDPVENVSLIPWLLQLTLLHTLKVLPRYSPIQRPVLLLSLAAGISAVFGLFLVRSGVLVSVHTFSQDSTRGVVLLAAVVAMLAYSGYTWFSYQRPSQMITKKISMLTREGVVLVGSYLIVLVFLIVVLGTLYPVIIQAMNMTMISVGAPYYNQLIIPLALVISALMIIQSHLSWGRVGLVNQRSLLLKTTISTCLMVWVSLNEYHLHVMMFLGVFLSSMLIMEVFGYSKSMAQRVSHAGFGLVILSLTFSTYQGSQADFIIKPGQEVLFSGFKLRMLNNREVKALNYESTVVPIQLIHQSTMKTILQPEKRIYQPSGTIISPVDVYSNLSYDFYVSVGQPAKQGGWVIRCYHKPLQSFLWLGSLLMILGVLTAFANHRSRRKSV